MNPERQLLLHSLPYPIPCLCKNKTNLGNGGPSRSLFFEPKREIWSARSTAQQQGVLQSASWLKSKKCLTYWNPKSVAQRWTFALESERIHRISRWIAAMHQPDCQNVSSIATWTDLLMLSSHNHVYEFQLQEHEPPLLNNKHGQLLFTKKCMCVQVPFSSFQISKRFQQANFSPLQLAGLGPSRASIIGCKPPLNFQKSDRLRTPGSCTNCTATKDANYTANYAPTRFFEGQDQDFQAWCKTNKQIVLQ